MKRFDYFDNDNLNKGIDPINTYGKALYTALKREGLEATNAMDITKKVISRRDDPVVSYYKKDENRDTVPATISLRRYITDYKKKDQCMVPTGTTYNNKLESPLADMTKITKQTRIVAKNHAKQLEKEGKEVEYIIANSRQNALKLSNNAISGATASKGTIFNNRTGHNTLTSLTSALTSLGNTLSETLLMGNRYYKTLEDLQRHIYILLSEMDYEETRRVVKQYELKIPTDEDMIDILTRSVGQYTIDGYAPEEMVEFLLELDSLERVMFAYHNDLYHTLQLNEDMILGWLLAMTDDTIIEHIDHLKLLNEIPEYLNMQIRLQESDSLKGNYQSYEELNKENPTLIKKLASRAYLTITSLKWFKPFIDNFLLTSISPIGTHKVANMMRYTISLSDTDSTAATYNYWCKRVINRNDIYCEKDKVVAAVMTTITSEILGFYIKRTTENMNIPKEKAEVLKFKNEFYFQTMNVSSKTKHYTAFTTVKEGFTFPKPKIDVKGVHLQTTRTPQKYLEIGYRIMDYINDRAMRGENFILEEFQLLGEDLKERTLVNVKKRDISLFNRNTIKDRDTYANADKPQSTPYFAVMLWNEVYGKKYPIELRTPIVTRGIPVKLKRVSEFKRYLELLPPKMSEDFKNIMSKFNKKGMATIQIPEEIINEYGVIPEIACILDERRCLDSALKNSFIPLSSIGAREVRTLGFTGANPQVDYSKFKRIFKEIPFVF